MRTLAAALLGTFALCACARSGTGANDQAEAGPDNAQTQASGQFHYDRPLLPSTDGTSLSVSALPSSWTRGAPGFAIRVAYRNAPQGAGLMMYIARDVPLATLGNHPSSGGGLMAVPVPIEGNGVHEVRFDGNAFLAPADVPTQFPIRAGRHIVIAYLLNHRRGVIGMVRQNPNDRILAEARSQPIRIE
ncbi:MAG TPA: hypothetical protein VIT38_15575 [Allosphingosinicella sp.]